MNIKTTHSTSNGVKVLTHGFSGTGKTRTAAHLFEAGYKILFVSAESGTLSIADYQIPMLDIAIDDNDKPIEMEKRFDRFTTICKWFAKGDHEFDTLFVDSFTEVNKALMAKLSADPKYLDEKMALRKYSANLEIMVSLARALRDLPFNVALLALSDIDKDDVGRRYVNPDFVGQVAKHLPPLFDEVLNLQVVEANGKKVTQFQTQSGNNVVAKDRSGKLKEYEPYNLASIFDRLGAKKKDSK